MRDIFAHGIVLDQKKKICAEVYKIGTERIRRGNEGLHEYK